MDNAKQQLIDTIKSSNNILVTVSRNPSVDQLASCIGLTLVLNKQGKHAAAVFSGQVPSTLEFLKPEDTLEKNTDSLRDFIIALDKSKADKLRYKVEDNVVRIFITPYRTSLSQDDLDFSEGDFNVDVVVALGVKQQEDLDEAITAHGRILHDATVASLNTAPDGGLGTINWHDPQASSLSELVTDLAQALDSNVLDSQIANALLTGIVSETNRFSNDKTGSHTMTASAALMAAGADQQLVASKLEEPESPVLAVQSDSAGQNQSDGGSQVPDDGMIQINHNNQSADDTGETAGDGSAIPPIDGSQTSTTEPPIDNPANTSTETQPPPGPLSGGSKLITEPPSLGGVLTANSSEPTLDPVTDPFSLANSEPSQLLDRKPEPLSTQPSPVPVPTPTPVPTSAPAFEIPPPGSSISPSPVEPPPEPEASPQAPTTPAPTVTSPPAAWSPPQTPAPAPTPTNNPGSTTDKPSPSLSVDGQATLTQLEQSVKSPHVATDDLDAVRDEVSRALSNGAPDADLTEPIQALNSQPLGGDLHSSDNAAPAEPSKPAPDSPPPSSPSQTDEPKDSSTPPPVPPPIPFQFGNPPKSQ